MPEYDLKFKDFTLGDPDAPGNELGIGEPVTFKIGKDVFIAPPILPPALAGRLVDTARGVAVEGENNGDRMTTMLDRVADIFDLILTPETAPRFRERLESLTEPIDLQRQAVPAMMWLLEVYGLRPTEPSSTLSDGLNDGGITSMDTAPTGV